MIQSGGDTAPPPAVEIGEAVVVEPGGTPEVRNGMAPEVGAQPAAGIMGDVELIPPMVVKRGQDGQIVEVTPGTPELIPPLVVEGPDGEGSTGNFD